MYPLGPLGCVTCGCCGLVVSIGPQKVNTPPGIERHYRQVDPHGKVADAKRFFFEEALAQMEAMAGSGGKRLLDVGCGYGYFLEVARRRGWQARGVEIVGDAVARARRILGEESVFHGRLQDASYPPGSFDAITLWDVLGLVDDPAAELERCFEVLADGGIVGLRLRNARFQLMLHRLVQVARTLSPGWMKNRPDVFNRFCFTPAAIHVLLRSLGFADIDITNSPLTHGNPYGSLQHQRITGLVKRLVFLVSRVLFVVSAGCLILGPSLLVWARKPRATETTLQP